MLISRHLDILMSTVSTFRSHTFLSKRLYVAPRRRWSVPNPVHSCQELTLVIQFGLSGRIAFGGLPETKVLTQ